MPGAAPGVSYSPALGFQFAAPTAAVAVGTSATVISAGVVPAISVGLVDVMVVWGMMSLNNTAASATSVTVSWNVSAGSTFTNLNGITPNFWLGATGVAGATTSFALITWGYQIQTNAAFNVGINALASQAGVNAYLNINGFVAVYPLVAGTV